MGEIEENIISEVKKFLKIELDMDAEDLYHQLFDYRTSVHPDKYRDYEQKADAEERFKTANGLLQRLKDAIERATLFKSPTELVNYQQKHELINARQDVISKD